jgi:hypothetical protein
LVRERLIGKVEDPDPVGATLLSDEECHALEIPAGARPRGHPPASPHLKEDIAYFVHAFTPWARYALQCRSALRKVFESGPGPNLWRDFALTYFPEASAARPSDRRREAVAALLQQQQPELLEETINKQARRLCGEMRRVILPPVPTRRFATSRGPTSPVWFLMVFIRREPTLTARGPLTPGTITERIAERFFSPVR